ncbi:hypothetical protein OCU04_001992 [Sclerotinia nivalis]|uniref:Uncharacterized protein n=1 Tax=Sclerotinia nivalis TaxID=352851 RepID=A0A9X0DS36_9HELO|nr:hypothetical protein OCU04_001992 [Sclerotinia nivalis]
MSEPTDAYSSFGMIPASPIRYGHNDFMSSDELPLPHAQEYDPTESTDQSTHGQDTSTYANINFLQQCPDISNASPGGFQPPSIHGYHQLSTCPNKTFQYLSRDSQNLSTSASFQTINCHRQATTSQTISSQTISSQTNSSQATSSSSLQANYQQADFDYTPFMIFGEVNRPRTTESSTSSC